MRKTPKQTKLLTRDDILTMFQMRAHGGAMKAIADRFGYSEWVPIQILKRRMRTDVQIPEDLLEKVRLVEKGKIPVKHKPYTRRAPAKATPEPEAAETSKQRAAVFAAFAAACCDLNDLRKKCRDEGFDNATLDLMQEAVTTDLSRRS